MGESVMLKLPHGETDLAKRYSMPNPYNEEIRHALEQCRHGEPRRVDMLLVLSLADAYIHLTTYELGQEHCVRQLREFWQARRAQHDQA